MMLNTRKPKYQHNLQLRLTIHIEKWTIDLFLAQPLYPLRNLPKNLLWAILAIVDIPAASQVSLRWPSGQEGSSSTSDSSLPASLNGGFQQNVRYRTKKSCGTWREIALQTLGRRVTSMVRVVLTIDTDRSIYDKHPTNSGSTSRHWTRWSNNSVSMISPKRWSCEPQKRHSKFAATRRCLGIRLAINRRNLTLWRESTCLQQWRIASRQK